MILKISVSICANKKRNIHLVYPKFILFLISFQFYIPYAYVKMCTETHTKCV